MQGDGLSFPVNPDAGGESAGYDWAGAVAPRGQLSDPLGIASGSGTGAGSGHGIGIGAGTGSQAVSYGAADRQRVSRGGSAEDMV
jgi:palmitoyltransferase